MGSILGPYRVIAKDVVPTDTTNSDTQMHDNKSMSRGSVPKKAQNHYHARLELPDKGRAIKVFIDRNF